MRLLFIVENYPPHTGGAEVVFENTCEGLAKRGHDVSVVTHRMRGAPRRELRNGVRVVRVPCFGNRYLFTFLAAFWALFRKADLVHTTTYNGAPPAWLVARLRRLPLVITVHETWQGRWAEYTDMPRWKVLLHEVLERPIWWLRYDRYLAVSESTRKQLEEVLPEKLHDRIVVNHNGFDPKPWKPRKQAAKKLRARYGLEDSFVILGYGRPGVSKGFRYLAEAAHDIKKKIKNAKIVLILSKNQTDLKERALIESHHDVRVLDPVAYEELPAHVSMADCVVIPSLCEGFGYAILETNTLNTPLVATNTGSIPEVISGKHLLIPPKDPTAITKAVVKVKEGDYKQTRLKKFSWRRNINLLEKTYEELKVVYE